MLCYFILHCTRALPGSLKAIFVFVVGMQVTKNTIPLDVHMRSASKRLLLKRLRIMVMIMTTVFP